MKKSYSELYQEALRRSGDAFLAFLCRNDIRPRPNKKDENKIKSAREGLDKLYEA